MTGRVGRSTGSRERSTLPSKRTALAGVALLVAGALTTFAAPSTAAPLPDLGARAGSVTQEGDRAEIRFKAVLLRGDVRRTLAVAGVNSEAGWIELGLKTVRGLAAGDPVRVRFDVSLAPLPPGTHTVVACVDAGDKLRERDEDNNCRDIGTLVTGEGSEGPIEPVVDGNRLEDGRTGIPWTPRGVNWPDLEYSCVQGWKPQHDEGETAAMAGWGIDVVRIPLNQDCWLGTDGAPAGEWLGSSDYRAAVKDRVDEAHAAGLTVILDLHWTAPAGVTADGQRAMADAQSVEFWSQVAAAYANDPAVMFELFNEPYSLAEFGAAELDWDCWRDGGCQVSTAAQNTPVGDETYEVAGMTELLAAVRGAGAEQPVLLGGLNYANDLTGWLAHRPADDQLVAAWHNYHGQGCGRACWDTTIAPIAEQVPVLMTEFGYSPADEDWMGDVMAWGDQHRVGYLAWAWWDLPLDTDVWFFALLEPGSFLPRAPAGTQFHDHLAAVG